MLKLKNIKNNNGIITASYDPEASGELGRISIDKNSGDVIESVASKFDSDYPIYLNHAIDALKKIKNEKELPEEKLVMWY